MIDAPFATTAYGHTLTGLGCAVGWTASIESLLILDRLPDDQRRDAEGRMARAARAAHEAAARAAEGAARWPAASAPG